MEKYTQTHRCEQLLKLNMSIRYYPNGCTFTQYMKGWVLSKPEVDFEWMTTYLNHICHIDYCPFCGKKLEETQDNDNKEGNIENEPLQKRQR